ncbi:phosphate/phosphite/phosphonate ABC transporter substrate-binding protein [Microlunatus parietis]|uniref:Phosphonate transport system substrate-binding protein n=1 Tax=Microlunatus parietis TaxID=682979 RepID=A0A7Y9I3W2_9ACTN|nr:phosphate/phosphite/phosphonate ABC transporter substrate-binding protein [Microlunatus parietis]NYE69798.1 phosphonate transport system substrate-binding protein [Microlunatus parietis]
MKVGPLSRGKVALSTRKGQAVLAAALLVGAGFLAGCGESAVAGPEPGADPDVLMLGHIPSENSSNIDEEYGLVMEVIEKETGKKVEFQPATSYAAVIEAQRAGKVQLASYGPFSYVVAKDSGVPVSILGFLADDKESTGGYHSLGLVPKDSPIKDLAGFKGKKVCFVDPTSTSGNLYPSAGLLESGLDPKKDVTPVFAGGHDSSAIAVATGQCDAGFAHDGMIPQLEESGQIPAGSLRTVWTSELIPSSPIVMSDTLSAPLKEKLTDIFSNKLNVDWLSANGYCDSADACTLPGEEVWGYKTIDDATYDGIRKVCEVTKADSCQAG